MEYLKRITIVASIVLCICSIAGAVDWPQFRGPTRDGLSSETGLMKKWPDGGPDELWSFGDLGKGYASVAVVDGIIYTTGMIG